MYIYIYVCMSMDLCVMCQTTTTNFTTSTNATTPTATSTLSTNFLAVHPVLSAHRVATSGLSTMPVGNRTGVALFAFWGFEGDCSKWSRATHYS